MKSKFKSLMEGIVTGKLKSTPLPLKNLNSRNATIDEIKAVIREAKKEAEKKSKEDEQRAKDMMLFGDESEGGWGDAEIANHLDFLKSLNIKEFFARGKKEDK